MTKPSADNPGGQPLGLPLNDQLGLVVDAAVINCWKANYGLEKMPAEIAAMWGNWAPSGAILALRAAVAEIERQRAELARCGKDNCMGRKVQSTTTWVTWEAREAAVAAERERLELHLSATRKLAEANSKRGDDCGMLARTLLDALKAMKT